MGSRCTAGLAGGFSTRSSAMAGQVQAEVGAMQTGARPQALRFAPSGPPSCSGRVSRRGRARPYRRPARHRPRARSSPRREEVRAAARASLPDALSALPLDIRDDPITHGYDKHGTVLVSSGQASRVLDGCLRRTSNVGPTGPLLGWRRALSSFPSVFVALLACLAGLSHRDKARILRFLGALHRQQELKVIRRRRFREE